MQNDLDDGIHIGNGHFAIIIHIGCGNVVIRVKDTLDDNIHVGDSYLAVTIHVTLNSRFGARTRNVTLNKAERQRRSPSLVDIVGREESLLAHDLDGQRNDTLTVGNGEPLALQVLQVTIQLSGRCLVSACLRLSVAGDGETDLESTVVNLLDDVMHLQVVVRLCFQLHDRKS